METLFAREFKNDMEDAFVVEMLVIAHDVFMWWQHLQDAHLVAGCFKAGLLCGITDLDDFPSPGLAVMFAYQLQRVD